MNERIEQLFGQALDQAVPETWATLNPAQLARLKDKFAELIVRECIGCCEQVISDPVPNYYIDTWLNGGSQCIDEIKQHFGVEQ